MDNEVKRIPCKNKSCGKTILDVTVKKTGDIVIHAIMLYKQKREKNI